MYDFLIYSITLLVLLWTAHRIYVLIQIRQKCAKNQDAQISNLFLPVLGVPKSGKTLLLASLGEHLSKYSTDQIYSRLLSHDEEKDLRGQFLKPFDADKADIEQPIEPGMRTTEAMIFYERELFKAKGHNAVTSEPENAYLSVEFSSTQHMICQFRDVPGEVFADESLHLANIDPLLTQAHGLILVVDGEQAYQRSTQVLSLYQRYQQIIKRYTDLNKRGPIWFVMTKMDLLPDEQRNLDIWKQYILDHVAPSLKLTENEVPFEIDLVSAQENCQTEWKALQQGGERFLLSLRTILNQRATQIQSDQTHFKKISWHVVAGILACCLMTWFASGTYSKNHLPLIQGDIEWTWHSVQSDTKKYHHVFRQSRHFWHPLQRFRKELQKDLLVLRGIHHTLLAKDLNQWANRLGKDRFEVLQVEWKALMKKTKLVQKLYSQQSWQVRSAGEKYLLEYINSIHTNLDIWDHYLSLTPQNISLDQVQKYRHYVQNQKWSHACQAMRLSMQTKSSQKIPSACLVQGFLQNHAQQLLKDALDKYAKQAKQCHTHESMNLVSCLSPLLLWKQKTNPLPVTPQLEQQWQAHIKLQWQQFWQKVSQLHKSKQTQFYNSPSHMFDELKQIQAIEIQRNTLSQKFSIPLHMPKDIEKQWLEILSQNTIKMMKVERKLTKRKRTHLQEILAWSQEFLDPHRRARVLLYQKETGWKQQLKKTLNAEKSEAFDHWIQQWQYELEELSSLEGRVSIQEGLSKWQERFNELKAWRTPRTSKFTFKDFSCSKSDLEMDKLDTGDGGYLDKFTPYMVLRGIGKAPYYIKVIEDFSSLVGDLVSDSVYELELEWQPWQTVTLELYEQDGDIDFEKIMDGTIKLGLTKQIGEKQADEKQKDKEQADEKQKDKEQTDKEQTDKKQADEKQTDKEKTDKKQADKEQADKEQTDEKQANEKQTDKEQADEKQKGKEQADKKQTDKEQTDKSKLSQASFKKLKHLLIEHDDHLILSTLIIQGAQGLSIEHPQSLNRSQTCQVLIGMEHQLPLWTYLEGFVSRE